MRNLDSRVRENDAFMDEGVSRSQGCERATANRDIGVSRSHGWLETTAFMDEDV